MQRLIFRPAALAHHERHQRLVSYNLNKNPLSAAALACFPLSSAFRGPLQQ